MAVDFDQFPTLDPLVKDKSILMSDAWASFMDLFYQNLIGYLGSNGMFVPQLTTTQRAAIQTPQIGQMIYNTTADQLQIFKASGWTIVV